MKAIVINKQDQSLRYTDVPDPDSESVRSSRDHDRFGRRKGKGDRLSERRQGGRYDEGRYFKSIAGRRAKRHAREYSNRLFGRRRAWKMFKIRGKGLQMDPDRYACRGYFARRF